MAYETSRAPGDTAHREHGGTQQPQGGALSGEGVRVHHPQDAAPVGGLLPPHVNPGIGLGDLINYSGLLGQLISAFVALKGSAVGASAKLPVFETWLPVGGEWEIDITAVRKR